MYRFFTLLLLALTMQTLQAQWTGSGTETAPYQIRTVAELATLATNVNGGQTYDGIHFRLENDLDLNVAPWNTGEGWIPIGRYDCNPLCYPKPFSGAFHGNGRVIRNLYINSEGVYKGLFGVIGGNCIIENLGLVDARVWCGAIGGSLVGEARDISALISGCYTLRVEVEHNRNSTSNGMYLGGLMGAAACKVINCYSTGKVTGVSSGNDVGGLIGRYNATTFDGSMIPISGCRSSVVVTGLANNNGGLIGLCEGANVSGCHATGNVSGSGGGLIGHMGGAGAVSDCYATGNVDGGGGGLLGSCNVSVSRCYATGNVTSNFWAGGLIGDAMFSAISECFASGYVKGNMWVGGLVGSITGGSTIRNSYAVGHVEGGNGIGGLVGAGGGVVSQCYAAGNILQSDVAAGNNQGNAVVGGTLGAHGGLVGYAGNTVIPEYGSIERSAVAVGSMDVISGVWGPVTSNKTATLTRNYVYDGMLINREPVSRSESLASMEDLHSATLYRSGLSWANFDTDWDIWEGVSFPYFKWQSAPARIDACTITGISGGVRPGTTVDSVTIIRASSGERLGKATLSGSNWTYSAASFVGETLRVTVYEHGKAPSCSVYGKVTDPQGQASANNNLSNLTVSQGVLSPIFSANVTFYTVNVANDVDEITINAAAVHPQARVTGTGSKQLRVGDNRHVVEVTAQNTNTKGYAVNIVRATAPVGPSVSGVSVTPSKAVVKRDAKQAFSATILITGGTSTAATWSVSGNNSTGTTIDKYGELTVAAGETAATLTVTATSVTDNTKSGTAMVTLTNETLPAAVTDFRIVPSPANVQRGGSKQLVADVSVQGGASGVITWRVTGHEPATEASITPSGLLSVTASERWNLIWVWATFSYDGSERMVDVYVNDQPSVTSIRLNPITATVDKGHTQQFTSYVETKGNASQAVEWSVTGNTSANTKISEKGLLTVGADEAAIELTVTSAALFDNTKKATAKVAVPNVASVTVSPATSNVPYGATQQFTAYVTAATGVTKDVTWSVSGNTSAATTINGLGLLTVAANETAGSLTVTASSYFDPTKKGTATVTTGGITSIVISPTGATVQYGKTRQFTVAVTTTGSATNGVTWTVTGKNSASTYINVTTGLLTVAAAETATTLTVTATSAFDNTKTGTTTVTLTSDAVTGVTISPAPATVQKGATQQFTATVATTGPAASKAVSWTVTGNASTETTINANGLLTVAIAETATSLTVKAVSTFDNTKSGTATVTVPHVTSVMVSPNTVTVQRETTRQFTATVTVTGGASQTVTWSVTGNTSSATGINASGLLTIAAGETAATLIVTATSALDNTKKGTATVTIPTVTGVTVSPATATVQRGKTQAFTANVTVTGGASSGVTWSISGNEFTGTNINAAGYLTVAAGETAAALTVTATSTLDNTKKGTATVTLIDPITVTSVTVSPGTVSVPKAGTQQFTATVTVTGGASTGVTWSIWGQALVATNISATGLLTVAAGETAGTIYVTATSTADNSRSGSATVTVAIPVTSVTVSPSTLSLPAGQKQKLTATVQPADAANKNVTWSSSATGIATVNTTTGEVTAVAVGSAVITAVTQDGDKTATCDLTVTDEDPSAVSAVTVTPRQVNVQKGATQQFTADVTATGYASAAVTWAVIGNVSPYTTISQSGLLTVSASETAATLSIMAASVFDNTKKGAATVTVENVTGVEELDIPGLKLYPNPFTGLLHLVGADGCTLQVVNAAGAVVHTQKVTNPDETIHLESLPDGMYFFRLEKDKQVKTIKVVKE